MLDTEVENHLALQLYHFVRSLRLEPNDTKHPMPIHLLQDSFQGILAPQDKDLKRQLTYNWQHGDTPKCIQPSQKKKLKRPLWSICSRISDNAVIPVIRYDTDKNYGRIYRWTILILCRARSLEYERKRSALTQGLPYAVLGTLRKVSTECESMVHASGELVNSCDLCVTCSEDWVTTSFTSHGFLHRRSKKSAMVLTCFKECTPLKFTEVFFVYYWAGEGYWYRRT